MDIIYTDSNTKVVLCYVLSNDEIDKISKNIEQNRKRNGFLCTRTAKSYAREIKGHKRLYRVGILRNHTIDADLSEHISCLEELIWKMIGR